jgi:hypothetical protein
MLVEKDGEERVALIESDIQANIYDATSNLSKYRAVLTELPKPNLNADKQAKRRTGVAVHLAADVTVDQTVDDATTETKHQADGAAIIATEQAQAQRQAEVDSATGQKNQKSLPLTATGLEKPSTPPVENTGETSTQVTIDTPVTETNPWYICLGVTSVLGFAGLGGIVIYFAPRNRDDSEKGEDLKTTVNSTNIKRREYVPVLSGSNYISFPSIAIVLAAVLF